MDILYFIYPEAPLYMYLNGHHDAIETDCCCWTRWYKCMFITNN